MSAIVCCPECRRTLQVPDDFFGKTVRCPECRHAFVAQPAEAPTHVRSAPGAPPALPSAAPAPSARPPAHSAPARHTPHRRDEFNDDDDDFDDLRIGRHRGTLDPDRGGLVLGLGIASLTLAFMSFLLYILPVWIIPIGTGIFGWVMGQRDLRAMREGTMDPTNHTMTMVGMVLSIVGLGLAVCVMLLACGVLGMILVMIGVAAANAPPPPPPMGPR